jgi:hypothetical protein
MKKSNNFSGVFWMGVIPLSLIFFVIMMFIIGTVYATFKKPDSGLVDRNQVIVEHVCPKPEKVYVHDTVYIKIPQVCHKEHFSAESKPVVSEPTKSANDTNNADNSNPSK